MITALLIEIGFVKHNATRISGLIRIRLSRADPVEHSLLLRLVLRRMSRVPFELLRAAVRE